MSGNLNENYIEANWLQDTLTVIVLYNISLDTSLTFQSLKRALNVNKVENSVDLLIYNNSMTYTDNIDALNSDNYFNIYYVHDSSNPGVSKAYNSAAELAGILKKEYLLILDQDTNLPPSFCLDYQYSINTYPSFPVYAPQVYSGHLLFSPCRYLFRKGSNLSTIKPGKHPMRYKNVLNSGLLINLNAFRLAGGYNEKVKLYFSDFVFFDRLKRYYNDFIVIDCRLDHQLSSVDYKDIDVALTRFSYYCAGARQASQGDISAYLNQAIVIGIRSILMNNRFKSLKFFKVYKEEFLGF